MLKTMELYEPLPVNLKSTYKEGIVPAVRQQLEFLWRAVHAVTLSQSLAHSLGRKFMELGNKYGLVFPEQVKNRICTNCSAILLPSITSKVRIQSRGKNSKIHKKKHLIPRGDTSSGDPDLESTVVVDSKIRRKLKNQIVTTCMTCSHISRILPGCEKIQKSKVEKGVVEEYTNENNYDIGAFTNDSNTKFSFLQNRNRRASAPARVVGDFIPLSNDENINGNSNVKNSFFTKAKNASLINSKSFTIPKDVNLETEISGEKRPLTLLELEQQSKRDKKNRRKTIDFRSDDNKNTTVSNNDNSNRVGIQSVGYTITSLSSIQNMFKKK